MWSFVWQADKLSSVHAVSHSYAVVEATQKKELAFLVAFIINILE